MSRKYTLELTAEELEAHYTAESMAPTAVDKKITALTKQSRADRAADELKLPWRYERNGWGVCGVGCGTPTWSDKAAKLMSAAPELLEAVKAADSWGAEQSAGTAWWTRWCKQVRPLIVRALAKVETGVPEE